MNGWMDVGATAEKVYKPSEWRLANDFDWSSFTVKKKNSLVDLIGYRFSTFNLCIKETILLTLFPVSIHIITSNLNHSSFGRL